MPRDLGLIVATALAALLLGAAPASARPKVAVMELGDQTRSLSQDLQESLTDALRSRLAQSGSFVVIDKSRQAEALRRLVSEQKKESYRACYASSCQIPLGQALAADTILRTKLTLVGSTYLLIGELVDLTKEAVTHAAQARIAAQPRAGRDDRLLDGVERLARQLTGDADAVGLAPVRRPVHVRPVHVRPVHVRPEPTPEQIEAHRLQQEAYQRQAEQRRRQAEETRQRREIEHQRLRVRQVRASRMIYGWMAVASGGILGAAGAYYMTAKAGDSADQADGATSPGELQQAADEAEGARTTGLVLVGLGVVTAGVGAYLLLSMPRLAEDPVRVGDSGLLLDRIPSAGPTADGVGLSWGGRF